MTPLSREFFQRDPEVCAAELVGCLFRWNGASGRIVETEAYAEHGDEACHTFFRPSARDFVVREGPGSAYIYLNYGVHWLTNILCKNPENGNNGFVLLRALEPVEGIEEMKRRRGRDRLRDLCSGPGKLSAALGIGRDDHGACLITDQRSGLFHGEPGAEVLADRRIGISRAVEVEWRFLEKGNEHVSVPYGKIRNPKSETRKG